MTLAPRYRTLVAVVPVVLALDILTKWLIRRSFRVGETMEIIAPVFGLTHVHNPGAAFSFLADAPAHIREPFFFIVPVLALIFLAATLRKLDDRHRLSAFGVSLVIGGALGNILDRLRFGHVVDFLDLHWREVYHWPRFNVADCAIVIGVILLVLPRIEPKAKPRGHSLVGVLVATALMSMVALAFLTMFKSQSKASRHIAALGGVTDFSQALDLQFRSGSCATMPVYKHAGVPATVTGGLATPALVLDSVANLSTTTLTGMLQPFTIGSISMASFGAGTASGAGFAYPFHMRIDFAAPSGPPPQPLNKFIMVHTDAAHVVQGACYSGGAGGGAGVACSTVTNGPVTTGGSYNFSLTASCPADTVLTGGGCQGIGYVGGYGGGGGAIGKSYPNGNAWRCDSYWSFAGYPVTAYAICCGT